MRPLKVYARYEKTTDNFPFTYHRKDVQIYKDKEGREPFARFMFFQKKPTRASRYVVLNCYRWALEWLA